MARLDLGRRLLIASTILGPALVSPALSQTAAPNATSPAAIPAPIQVTGTLVLHVSLDSAVANGTQVYITADAETQDANYSNDSENYETIVKVANGQAVATITIPYNWTVGSKSDQVMISIYAAAAPDATTGQVDSSYPTATITLPANGATTPVTIVGGI